MAVLSAIVGAIIGFVWSFALNFSYSSGLIYGGIGGFILGILMTFLNKAVTDRGNVQKSETHFVSGSLLGLFLLAGVATGLIAWLIRYIFF